MKKISSSIKNMTFSDWVYWGMALVPFAISLAFYSRLPERVPTHWNGAGEVNGYSSRLMACFGIPGFMLLMAVVINFAYMADPKRANIARSRELKQITRWFIVILAVLVQCITMLSGVGVGLNVGLLTSVPIAILFIVIGNYMPKCKQNYTLGIKLPWTLADEDNWNRTHRLAGYVWTLGGLAMLAFGLVGRSGPYFAIVVAIILIPTVYSYVLWKRSDGGKNHGKNR